jgi:hypothetical protein
VKRAGAYIREQAQAKDRRCDVCSRPTGTVAYLCRRHLHQRKKLGSARVSGGVLHRNVWRPWCPHVNRYLSRHPPDREVLNAALALVTPGNTPRPSEQRWQNKRWLLWRELVHWHDPRARFHGRHGRYDALGILRVLLAVTVYIEDRDGRGFPDDAEDFAKVHALLTMVKRRDPWTRPVSVMRTLGARIRKSLGMYLLTTARAILAEHAKRPAPPPDPNPTTHPELYVEERRPEYVMVGDARVWTGKTISVMTRRKD